MIPEFLFEARQVKLEVKGGSRNIHGQLSNSKGAVGEPGPVVTRPHHSISHYSLKLACFRQTGTNFGKER